MNHRSDLQRGPSNPWASLLFDPVVANAGGQFVPATFSNLGLGTSAAVFAFYGFGSAIYPGEETQRASRQVARAAIRALVISVVAHVVLLAALLHGAPHTAQRFQSDTMFGDMIRARGGQSLATAINVSIALAIFNANVAIVIFASRMVFSTGRDQVWSRRIDEAIVRVDDHFRSPRVAMLFTGALSGLLSLLDFQLLLVASGTALMVVYGYPCVAVIAGRRNGATAHALCKIPLYPLPPVLALVAFAYIVFTNGTNPETGLTSFLATAVILTASALHYQLALRTRGE